MKIFIDSADLNQIEKARSYGVLDGVTTNPSLIKKAVTTRQKRGESVDMRSYIQSILEAAHDVPVSLEVIGTDRKQMEREGRFLYETFNPVAGNVYVKIPVNPAFSPEDDTHFQGIETIKALADDGIPVNCTLVFTPEQSMLAAKAGARVVSPFAGRIDDLLRTRNNIDFDKTDYFPAYGLEQGEMPHDNGIVSGIDLVIQCVEIMKTYGFQTEVLAASIRNTRQTREAALAGAHIATLPFEVISRLLVHEKTMEGMQGFVRDVVPEYAELLS